MPRKSLDPGTIVLYQGHLCRVGPKGSGRTRLLGEYPGSEGFVDAVAADLTDEGTLQDQAAEFLAKHPDGALPLGKSKHDGPAWLCAMTREELTEFAERAEMPFR